MSAKIVILFCLVALASAAPQQAVPVAPVANAFCLTAPIADPTARCSDFSLRWYYDPISRDCEEILYSGCGGSQNLFATEYACEFTCEQIHDRSYESVENFDWDK